MASDLGSNAPNGNALTFVVSRTKNNTHNKVVKLLTLIGVLRYLDLIEKTTETIGKEDVK
jgi:hypothetical protein